MNDNNNSSDKQGEVRKETSNNKSFQDVSSTSDSSDLVSKPPQSPSTTSQDPSKAPKGTSTTPSSSTPVPQGTATAPQGTATAPQGTATAPQGTATAPQGTATAPQGTSSSPTISGDAAYQGSQAEIIIQDGKVLKVYKHGFGFNAAVLPLVQQLNGKGYLVDLYDFGTMDYQGEQRQFELMEYCPAGAVSAQNLKGNKEVILKIAVKTALALDACHRLGFLHKDVKPANILIRNTKTWDCVLCDFGIADILDHGKTSAVQDRTPIYAAPEVYVRTAVIEGRTYCELTPASDFYSLGMSILCMWYGESAFRSQESIMAIKKVHDGITVPPDMPDPLNTITRGLLVKDPKHRWGLREIQDFLQGKPVEVYDERPQGGLNIVFNGSKNQVAHSLEELAAFMVDDPNLAIKYLYSGKISKWLEQMPEVQVEIERIIEKNYAYDQTMGFLAAVHLLNPFYDLNLCCDLNHPDYAMTGEAIGRLLNKVYYLYFTKYDAYFDTMKRLYDASDTQSVRMAGIVYNVAHSFERGSDGEYFPWFLDHKGKRFEQQRKWFNYCVLPSKDDQKKAGPKDKKYRTQVAMMKCIKGFGAVPEYRLSRTGEVLTCIDDLYRAPKKELKHDLQHDKGLRGWLAVQFHENPHADLKPKYAYEKLLEQYVEVIGYIDDNDVVYSRFTQARDQAKDISTGAVNKIKSTQTQHTLQKVIAVLFAVLPLVFVFIDIVLNLIDSPILDVSKIRFESVVFLGLGLVVAAIAFFAFDEDGCIVPIIIGLLVSFVLFGIIKFLGRFLLWFYALAVLAALVFFGIVTLFGDKSKKQKINTVANPGFEELTLEPLYFAFNSEQRFDSSLNGLVNSDAINKWNKEVKNQWIMVALFVGSAVLLTALSTLLPNPRIKNVFGGKAESTSTKATEPIQTETVYNVLEYADFVNNT